MTTTDTCFEPAVFDFLAELELNNRRDWFEQNRDRYESELREPAFELIRAVRPMLQQISPSITARDTKVGGSLMRIFRDVRFSPDKTPYKTNIGIQFRHRAGRDVHAPGYYVHLSLDECFIGAGSWTPDRDALALYRDAIAERGAEWLTLIERYSRGGWRIDGDKLKRPPRGWDKDHPMIEEIKRKQFIAVRDFEQEDVLAPDFPEQIAEWCRESQPLMAFLCKAARLEF